MAQTEEARAFLARLSQIDLKNPQSTLESAIRPALEDESLLRRLFASERESNVRLKDPHVGLVNVYGEGTDNIRSSHPRIVNKGPAQTTDDAVEDSPPLYVESELDRMHIMPLSDEKRLKHGEPCMAPTFEDFKLRWSIFTEGSLSQLSDWSNVVAAGGSVLACLLPLPPHVVAKGSKRAIRKYYHSEAYPASDVDLFLYGLSPEQAEVKANLIYESIRDSVPWEVTAVRTKHAVSIHCQYPYRPVQIILRLYASPAEILAGFDVDSSCVAFDGQHVLAAPRAVVALMTQCNTVAVDRRSPSYEVRLAKYAARGFEICVPDLRRQDIDPTIFERTINRVQGLARLIVLEKLPTVEERESFVAGRRKIRGRPRTETYGRARVRNTKGDLKAAAINNLDGIVMSDYDVAFHVPYGPGIDARRVEKLIYQTDLGMNSTFNPKNKDRKLHRHPAFFGTMKEVLDDCCEHCPVPQNEEEIQLQEKEDEQYIRGRVSFMQEDPGRQSITGSFNPIDTGEWASQAYVQPITKLFNLISKHDRNGVQHFIKTNANPENDPLKPTARDFLGRTPLQFAVICGATDIALDLVEQGARMTARMVDGKTALHLACQLSGGTDGSDVEGLVTIVKRMMSKSDENKIAKEKIDKESLQNNPQDNTKSGEAGPSQSDADSDRIRDSSEDDWSTDLADDAEEEGTYKEAKKNIKVDVDAEERQPPVPEEADLEENLDEPDILDLDAPDWDQCMTPLAYAIVAGSVTVVKHLLENGADFKSPFKVKDGYNQKALYPLTLTALTPSPSSACAIVELLVQHGASSTQADAVSTTTVFHTLVAANKVEIVETLLRVDPTAKTACRFLSTPSWGSAIHPIVTAISGDYRAMVALLVGYGNVKLFISREDFDRSAAANPNRSHNDGGLEKWQQNAYQPLEAALKYHNSIYKLIVEMEPENIKTAVPKQVYYYRGSTGYRRSVLDWVKNRINELKKKLKDSTKKLTAPTLVVKEIMDDDALQEAAKAAGSSETWTAEVKRLVRVQEGIAQKAKRAGEDPAGDKQLKEQERKYGGILKARIQYYEEARDTLVAAGVQSWDEIYPKEKSTANIDEDVPDQDDETKEEGSEEAEAEPWRKYFQFTSSWYAREVGDYLEELYDELYEAVWRGDNDRVKELCLPPEDPSSAKSTSPQDLLQITVAMKVRDITTKNAAGWTPLFAAIQARQWTTAKVILDIAEMQYHEEEEKKATFSSKRGIVLDDSDNEDDDENSEEGSDHSAETEKLGVDSIAARFNIVHTTVQASSLFTQAAMTPIGAERDISINVLTKAIAEHDVETFEHLCELMENLKEPIKLNDDHLTTILSYDSPSILDVFIRRTGIGLLLENSQSVNNQDSEEMVVDDDDSEMEEENRKMYLGLNVHGKKRKDLVRKGDPDAPGTDTVPKVPLLWRACKVGAIRIIEYLASSAPLDAYKSCIANVKTKPSKRLGAINDLDSKISSLLGFTLNEFSESPLLAALGFKRDCLQSLKTLMKVAPKLTSNALNASVKVQRYTPLLCAATFGTNVDIVDWLLSNGASPLARDCRGWNVLHILCNSTTDSDFDLLRHLLTKLPEETIITLLDQQSKGERDTPLSIAVKKGFVNKVAFLLGQQSKSVSSSLGIRRADGSVPLHIAAFSGFAEIASLLVKAGHYDMLYLENGVGATALEIARLGYLTHLIRAGFPGVAIEPQAMENWTYSSYTVSGHTGLTEQDQGEVKGLRKVVDALQRSGTLANKPDVLQALTTFAELSEKELLDARHRNPDADPVEEDSKVRNRTEVCDRKATFSVFAEAVVSVPSRFLVHLHEVQAVVLSAVNKGNQNKGTFNRRRDDDLGSEGEAGEDDNDVFLLASPDSQT